MTSIIRKTTVQCEGHAHISRSISCSHPPALDPIRALVAVTASSPVFTLTDKPPTSSPPCSEASSRDVKYEFVTESNCAFKNKTTVTTTHCLCAIVRAVATTNPELCLYTMRSSTIERWIDDLLTAGLVDVAYMYAAEERGEEEEKQKEKEQRVAVEQFASKVEEQLDKSKYLVGRTVTAADVVVCVVLAEAARRTGVVLGERTKALVGIILDNPTVRGALLGAAALDSIGE